MRAAFADVPFPPGLPWPHVSVIVCSYNGSRTIRDCLAGLQALDYSDYEVIVVDDGSTDDTAAIAAEYGFRVISTENRGLSSARNTGLEAATSEIVAYIDDDAYPDAHWLTYLAATFLSSTHVGVGGPNIAPSGDGPIADCVANAPGGPIHVLLSDREAEHIPGCNMAFRRAALQEIGGFDSRFRAAGDDVDVCWRLRERGWTLGFSPAAVVWHHRRNSVRTYWKQQVGYGKAEALLERKWPEQYNALGHVAWTGQLYGKGLSQALPWRRERIYQGTWGAAPFQSLYQRPLGVFLSLPLMPEWYLAIVALAALTALAFVWTYFFLALPLLALVVGAPLVQAGLSAARASFQSAAPSRVARLRLRCLTALLHLLQPLARLSGRIRHGLTLWRRRDGRGYALPYPRTSVTWPHEWQPASERLALIEAAVRESGAVVRRGGSYDRWDLEARGGTLATARLRLAIEEHGAGRQVIHVRIWPRWSRVGPALVVLSAALAAAAAFDAAWAACSLLAGLAGLIALRMAQEAGGALAALLLSALKATAQGKAR